MALSSGSVVILNDRQRCPPASNGFKRISLYASLIMPSYVKVVMCSIVRCIEEKIRD